MTATHELANCAKSQFLSSMSHDIRTPLNGVLGMTELLLNTALSAQQRRYAQTVYDSGEALLAIINDILDYSKIEAGRLELHAQSCALAALVEEAADLLAPRAHQKRLELTCQIDPAVPAVVMADAARLSQVLVNLIGNAIKFTASGEINVRVTCEDAHADDAGSTAGAADTNTSRSTDANTGSTLLAVAPPRPVRFSVTDSGIGISTEMQRHLTHAFEMGDTTASRRLGGAGLGLIICQRLLGMMGGHLEMRSTAGCGSSFSFAIALPAVNPDAQTHDAALLAPRSAAAGALAGQRVLIVDDNATNRGIMVGQLHRWGAGCAAASDAYQALDMLRAAQCAGQPFAATLIDMKMPGMSGVELAETLQRDDHFAALPRLMLTSISAPGEIARARAAGVSVWLEKPVRASELYKALASALTAPGAAAGAVASALPPAARLRGSILLVEDNPVNREIAIAMLDSTACRVAIAENGRQALAQLADQAVDLVLMDCQMPEMDGFEAVRLIRASPSCGPGVLAVPSDVPVIALTANAMAGDRERCLAAGFDGYLAKPYAEAALHAMLRQWLPVTAQDGDHRDGAQQSEAAAPNAMASIAARDPRREPVSARTDFAAATPGRVTGATVLDPHTLQRLLALERNGTRGLIPRLARTFLDSTPALFEQLRAALEGGHLDDARNAAHTLKTSHANLGALEMSALCARIEAHAHGHQPTAALACLPEAEDQYARVMDAVTALAIPPGSPASAQIVALSSRVTQSPL